MTLEAIRYRSGSLQILDQLLLPHQTVYTEIRSVDDAYRAIKAMKVRSARSTGIHQVLQVPCPPVYYWSVGLCLRSARCFVLLTSFWSPVRRRRVVVDRERITEPSEPGVH